MKQSKQNQPNIRVQLARILVMELEDLRGVWLQVFGKPAPDCGKVFLRRQLAYKIQEKHFGGITATADAALKEIASKPKVVPNRGGAVPGTIYKREWQGKIHTVVATHDGFEYNGMTFKSLSGVAHAITGTQWSGKKFFGVDKK